MKTKLYHCIHCDTWLPVNKTKVKGTFTNCLNRDLAVIDCPVCKREFRCAELEKDIEKINKEKKDDKGRKRWNVNDTGT